MHTVYSSIIDRYINYHQHFSSSFIFLSIFNSPTHHSRQSWQPLCQDRREQECHKNHSRREDFVTFCHLHTKWKQLYPYHGRDELDDNAGLAIVHQAKANLSIDSSSSIPIIIGTRWPYTDYDLHCGCNSFKVPQSSCCFRKNPLEEKRSLLGFRSSLKALDGKKNKHWADIVDRWFCEYHFQCWQQLVVSSLQIQER